MLDRILIVLSNSTGLETKFLRENLSSPNLWDSFSKVEIVLNLESEFGIQFDDEELSGLNTVNEVLNIVSLKAI